MTDRTLARVAWGVVLLTLLLSAISVLVAFLSRLVALPVDWAGWIEEMLLALSFMVAPIVGGLIATRQPRNLYGWTLLLFGLGFGVTSLAQRYAAYALRIAPGAAPFLPATLVLAGFGWFLWIAMLPFLLLLFPTGRLPSHRWRAVAWGVITTALIGPCIVWAAPGPSAFAPIENPLGVEGVFGEITNVVRLGAVLVIFLAILAGVVSLIVRFRRAQGIERQQFKWLAYAAALLGVLLILEFLIRLPGVWNIVIFTMIPVVAPPIAIGIAILRYRLYDIDVIIRRTLVYSLLTIILGLVYFGCILVSRAVIAPLTGESELAIVISTLAIAGLFLPLRRRIQMIIDKRFYRRKYDAAKVLAAFGATARDETNLDALTGELLRVVDETMQPEFVGLWLRDPQARSKTDDAQLDSKPPHAYWT
jgi:hypothetical protein